MRALASILIVSAWSAAAHADTTAALPRGMKLAIESYHLYVERGAVKARWPLGSQQAAESIEALTADATTGKVSFDVDLCNPTVHVDTTLDALEARVVNVEGL